MAVRNESFILFELCDRKDIFFKTATECFNHKYQAVLAPAK